MAPTTYAEVLTRNIRAARSRQGLDQKNIVARMRALGHDKWHRQTMGKVERGERRVTTEEMLALALALETSIAALMAPTDEDKIIGLPSGETVTVTSVWQSARWASNDGEVRWEGDVPVFEPRAPGPLFRTIPQDGKGVNQPSEKGSTPTR